MSGVLSVFSKVAEFTSKYPITRGMASYAVIWPIGSLIQQRFLKENEKELDYKKAAKFALYGSCFVAPTIHAWLTLARIMFPLANLRSAIAKYFQDMLNSEDEINDKHVMKVLNKALIEQFTYTPFAMVCFYCGMTLLEGGTVEMAKQEVHDKFVPTYQVGFVVWPCLQTLNYTVIAEKNRVVFVSFCSLMWTTFLAYMKHLEGNKPVETHTPTTVITPTLTKRPTSEPVWPFNIPLEH